MDITTPADTPTDGLGACRPNELSPASGSRTIERKEVRSREYLNNFDFIRLALALLVIYSHSYILGTGSESAEPFNLFTKGQSTGGAVAVNLFFVISGYLITQSYERSRSVWSYFEKRIRRIYPGYIVIAILTVVILCRGRVSLPIFVGQTLLLGDFLQEPLFTSNPYPGVTNGSLWSIRYEFWCYIGIALLGVTGFLRKRAFVSCLFVITLIIGFLFQALHWRLSGGIVGLIFGYPPFWARLLPLYLAGVMFYFYRDRIPLNRRLAVISVIGLIVASVFPPLWSLLFPIAATYLTMWFAFNSTVRFYGFARYGDFSYGTYLYAFPIQQTIMKMIGHPVAPIVLFSIATPLTLLAAFCSWHGVEKWFLPRRNKVKVPEPVPPQQVLEPADIQN